MAKVKIPLKVNGENVRNMEELILNFDAKDVLSYFLNGKLHKWLEDRYYDNELEAISKLDSSDCNLADKLCKIFGVKQDTSNILIEDVSKDNEKLEFIREFTDDDELINQSNRIARNQEELDKLVSRGEKKIYLFDGIYKIDLNFENVKYIGINNVVAHISSEEIVPFDKKNIELINIEFDDNYKKLKKTKMIGNRFIISGEKMLFSDENGKLKFIKFNSRMIIPFYGSQTLDVLKEIDSDGRKKNVQNFFDKSVNSPIISLCGLNGMYGAVDENGCIYTWSSEEQPNIIENISNAVQIECGMNKYFAMDMQGRVFSWEKEETRPVLIEDKPLLKQLAVGGGVVLGLTIDGKVVVIEGSDRRIDISESLPPIKKITVSAVATYCLSEEGIIYAWGNRYACQIPENIIEVCDIGIPGNCTPIVDVGGNIQLCGLKKDVELLKPKLKNIPKAKAALKKIEDYIFFISEDNELYCNNCLMHLKRKNQEKAAIKIYDTNI